MSYETDLEIPQHNRDMIEWLKGFRRTHSLQRLIGTRKFSREELEFLKTKLVLEPKKSVPDTTKWS